MLRIISTNLSTDDVSRLAMLLNTNMLDLKTNYRDIIDSNFVQLWQLFLSCFAVYWIFWFIMFQSVCVRLCCVCISKLFLNVSDISCIYDFRVYSYVYQHVFALSVIFHRVVYCCVLIYACNVVLCYCTASYSLMVASIFILSVWMYFDTLVMNAYLVCVMP